MFNVSLAQTGGGTLLPMHCVIDVVVQRCFDVMSRGCIPRLLSSDCIPNLYPAAKAVIMPWLLYSETVFWIYLPSALKILELSVSDGAIA